MSFVKGLSVMIPPILIAFVEIYYLIILPLIDPSIIQMGVPQYWALAIPVSSAMVLISVIAIWIGYTMIVTPEPIRLTYEEAYEEAAEELNNSE